MRNESDLKDVPFVVADDVLLGVFDGGDVGEADIASRLVVASVGVVVNVSHWYCRP